MLVGSIGLVPSLWCHRFGSIRLHQWCKKKGSAVVAGCSRSLLVGRHDIRACGGYKLTVIFSNCGSMLWARAGLASTREGPRLDAKLSKKKVTVHPVRHTKRSSAKAFTRNRLRDGKFTKLLKFSKLFPCVRLCREKPDANGSILRQR